MKKLQRRVKLLQFKGACRRKINLESFALRVSSHESFTSLSEIICSASQRGMPGARLKPPINLKETCYTKCTVQILLQRVRPRSAGHYLCVRH